MRLDIARKFILEELQSSSLNKFSYHNTEHSKEVESACMAISKSENLTDIEIELLIVAALTHDIGYVEDACKHEEVGCIFITKHLPDFGYNDEEVELIKSLIMATKFPHNPNTLLEKIICDSDLSYIGLGSYETQSENLRKELVRTRDIEFKTEKDWIVYQIDFLEKHKFFTKYAKKNYNSIKHEIIISLKQKLTPYIPK